MSNDEDGVTRKIRGGLATPGRILVIFGFVLASISLIAWSESRKSVAGHVTRPLVTSFPTEAGEQLEKEFRIASASNYVLTIMLKPANLREFESKYSQLPCDIDVRITKGDNLILQERVDKLEMRLTRGQELGYDLVWTKRLTPGQYGLYIDNHRDILYQSAEEPVLIAFINPAELETRVVIYEMVKYLCLVSGLIGIIAIVVGILKEKSRITRQIRQAV